MTVIKKIFRIIFQTLIILGIGGILLTGTLRLFMLIQARPKTFLPTTVEKKPVALVLGAGLNRDGTAGLVLRDRVKTATELYFEDKVEKLLMSGDNSTQYYDEPGAMKDYAVSLGVPEDDIVLDFAGRRTYDSCYRAKAIFELNELIVVSQAYHLPRALYLCNAFDIEAIGVPADDANYRRSSYTFWWVREILASINAVWDVTIAQPEPILGPPEPIFP
jgi:vancomycin permeability regulator SanA